MKYNWYAYIPHDHIQAYEDVGWQHPRNTVIYPRLDGYGTTMEWIGDGDPPVPEVREIHGSDLT